MVKKIRRMRTFVRTASKSMEKKLVENAKKIKADPYLVIPKYSDKYSEKVFNKIRKNIAKINKFKDDPKKLEKLSNLRDLRGAIAGSMLLANSEKAPYLAVAKFPTGDITYAQRGKADKEKMIAIQHIDDPVLRILGIKDVVLKKKLHVYSWDDSFVSTGLDANPPKEFLEFIAKKLGLKMEKNVAFCGDIKAELLRNSEVSKKNYIRLEWKSPGFIIGICESCAKSDKNTLFEITKYMVSPNLSNDFNVDVVGQVVKAKDTVHKTEFIEDYLSGKINDLDFIKKNLQQREKTIKESGELLFILDGVSFGTNVEDFINALKPNKYEKEGLDIILNKINEPVVFDDATPNKVLEHFWGSHGLNTLDELINDRDMAENLFSLKEPPSEILEIALNYKERRNILSQLPKYKSLPTVAKFADNIARTYRTFGENKALAEIKNRPDNTKAKSVSYAFLLALNKGEDKKWQYSSVEIEYGEFLKEYAKKLLDVKPEKYHNTLKDLLVACGSSEDIDDSLIND